MRSSLVRSPERWSWSTAASSTSSWPTRGRPGASPWGRSADHPQGADILGSVTGAEGAATPDLLGVLNDAFSTEPVVLDVPAGVAVDEPVRRGRLVGHRRSR